LFVLTLSMFTIGVVAAGVVVPMLIRGHLVEQVDDRLPRVGLAAAAEITQFPAGAVPGAGQLVSLDGAYISVMSPAGEPMVAEFLEPADARLRAPDLSAVIADPTPGVARTVEGVGSGEPVSYRAAVIDLPNSGTAPARAGSTDISAVTMIAALPLTDVDSSIARIIAIELVVGGLLVVLVAGGTWALIGVGLAPLRRMEATAQQLTKSGFRAGGRSMRVPHPSARTEIGKLGVTLNELFDEIDVALEHRDESERRLRRFVADASHELRTPLTSVRGYAQLIGRANGDTAGIPGHAARIEAESERMTKLVDDLLRLARLDETPDLTIEDVAVGSVVNDVAADARAAAPDRAVTVTAAVGLVVRADRAAVTQVLVNLLANARTHTPAGSPIELVARAAGDLVEIDVIDHGPGVSDADRERIFDRFVRLDESRQRRSGAGNGSATGNGLGLAIVRTVIDAHGGSVSVAATPGGGATFRICLPRAAGR
jgi:two-component system, OmpR family, sensor kinase